MLSVVAVNITALQVLTAVKVLPVRWAGSLAV